MKMPDFQIKDLTIIPGDISLYIPPVVWKGDSVGHIGKRDVFFWVLEGECFLRIDSQSYVIHPGQLAFLPKGKTRAYTHSSNRFTMYEMSFDALSGNNDLMEILKLRDNNYVVDIPDRDMMSMLFETSHRKELFKNPVYDVLWCSNILRIICIYSEERKKQLSGKNSIFMKAISYMSEHLSDTVRTEDLATLCFMQPTYFVKRFHDAIGISPHSYFNRMRIYTAMGFLAGTDLSIEEISRKVGFSDTSYFTRIFKKYSNVTPSAYRKEFTVN